MLADIPKNDSSVPTIWVKVRENGWSAAKYQGKWNALITMTSGSNTKGTIKVRSAADGGDNNPLKIRSGFNTSFGQIGTIAAGQSAGFTETKPVIPAWETSIIPSPTPPPSGETECKEKGGTWSNNQCTLPETEKTAESFLVRNKVWIIGGCLGLAAAILFLVFRPGQSKPTKQVVRPKLAHNPRNRHKK